MTLSIACHLRTKPVKPSTSLSSSPIAALASSLDGALPKRFGLMPLGMTAIRSAGTP